MFEYSPFFTKSEDNYPQREMLILKNTLKELYKTPENDLIDNF